MEAQFFYIFIGFLIAVKLLSTVSLWDFLGADITSQISKEDIYSLTNQARSREGLTPLEANVKLQEVASMKLADMFKNGYFGHVSPAGTTPWHWFDKAGYNYKIAGENLAMDFIISTDVIDAWMNSESHKKNILLNDFTEIGVAVGSGTMNGRETVAVVEVFAAPVAPVKKVNPARSAVISKAVEKPLVTPSPLPTPVKTPVASPLPDSSPVIAPVVKIAKLAPISLAKEVASAASSGARAVYKSEFVEKAPETVRQSMSGVLVLLSVAAIAILLLKLFVSFRIQFPILIVRAIILVVVSAWMVWSGPSILSRNNVVITQKAETTNQIR